MNTPEFISSSAPHLVAMDEGSRDAKGRKSFVVEDERQSAVNSDDMAAAMDAVNRTKVSFSVEASPLAGEKEPINPDDAITQTRVFESVHRGRPVSPPIPPKFQVTPPLTIQTPSEAVIRKVPLKSVSKTMPTRHPEPDADIAARLDTLKAQNNALRTSLNAMDSQSLAQA